MATAPSFEVARAPDAVYMRIYGQGNMNNSATFQDFTDEMIKQGYEQFIVDLTKCQGMDSTFMGVLLGIVTNLSEQTGQDQPVVVLNASDHCRKQLQSIGLHTVLKLKEGTTKIPNFEMHPLDHVSVSAVDRLKLVMRAHQALVQLDEKNEKTFGAFLKSLSRELGKDT